MNEINQTMRKRMTNEITEHVGKKTTPAEDIMTRYLIPYEYPKTDSELVRMGKP